SSPSGPGHKMIAHPPVVGVGHHIDELGEADLAPPTQYLLRLLRVADQSIDLGRAIECRIDPHDPPAALAIDAALVAARALPFDDKTQPARGSLDKLAHAVALAGRQDKILRLRLLQHPPHALDIIAGKTPVALRLEIAELKHIELVVTDLRQRPADL